LIGRTAYPRFKRAVPVRELREAFTPAAGEIAWGAGAGAGAGASAGAGGVARCLTRGASGPGERRRRSGAGREPVAHGPLDAEREPVARR
jgi:hypothetical protein